DDGYPAALMSRLGTGAPPLLYVAGPADLLATGALGIVGSRDVAPAAADVAQQAARSAVANDLAVVSGGAKGVDQLSMTAARVGLRGWVGPGAVRAGDGAGPGTAALVERVARPVPEIDALFPLEPVAVEKPRDQLSLDV